MTEPTDLRIDRTAPRVAAQGAVALAAVVAATLVGLGTEANPLAAGVIYFLTVLALAIRRGLLAGALASVLATSALNYCFIPPVGTFHVAEPQNWVALAGFLVAATVASRLVARERQRALEAEAREREIEALYRLSLDLFSAPAGPDGLGVATRQALGTIGARSGGLVLGAEGGELEPEPRFWFGSLQDLEIHRLLARGPAPPADESDTSRGWRNASVPILVGGHRAGALVAYGTRATPATLQSVARMIALAMEREEMLGERARLAAIEAGDRLKTALLRAVSHDLSTPLTAIGLAVESLRRQLPAGSPLAEPVTVLGEESARLSRRIENLLALARLEAGHSAPRREPTPAADLFRAAREHLTLWLGRRALEVRVADDCPDLQVDPNLAVEILVNLLENAHRASRPDSLLEMVAAPVPTEPGRVRLEIRDRGAGLSSAPAPGDAGRVGLGLEIARSFAVALGGTVSLHPRDGGGVVARVDLPAVAPSIRAGEDD